MPSWWSKDGTDGLGAVPSVLGKSRTAHRPRPSDGTVDITDHSLMSQDFDTDEAVEPMLDFLFGTDVGRVTGVREEDVEEEAEEGGSSSKE
ncbi:hypothetical protein BDD12DRAFT_908026 [Trichophaea hybrida]|nr:hypothetical protein BDD12DRAFT_908026 [Trichophaea hybrida]